MGVSTQGVGTQRGEYPGSEYLEVGTHPLDMGPAGGGLVTSNPRTQLTFVNKDHLVHFFLFINRLLW